MSDKMPAESSKKYELNINLSFKQKTFSKNTALLRVTSIKAIQCIQTLERDVLKVFTRNIMHTHTSNKHFSNPYMYLTIV